ncbi:hypothetical protein LEMLEM_LOCUS11163, partial [Lemmus lemmus]
RAAVGEEATGKDAEKGRPRRRVRASGVGWPGRLRTSYRSSTALHAHHPARASGPAPGPDPVPRPRRRCSPSPSRPARPLLLAPQRKWTLRLTDLKLPFSTSPLRKGERKDYSVWQLLKLALVNQRDQGAP